MAPFILAFCLFSAGFVEASEKCYGVALEGGGTRGAYEAGALLALTEFLPVVETSYKIISGISIGAINACACAGFEVGDERNMALHVKDLWNGITSRKLIYSYWFGGLFYRPSVLNNAAELK
jgi:predicted acylesterase/phospholipase RssA